MTTEELKNQQAAATPAAGAAAQPSRTDNINALYDAQKQAQLNNLQSAYEQNLSNMQAQRDKLPGQYRESANNLAVQYERNRLNQNRQFAANGINTGAASQAALSRSNEYLRDFGRLKAEENKAIADADRGINDLTAAYNRNVAAAGADIEANRTKALLDEQNRQQQLDLNKAQLLAQYGDFSMYANLYGQDVANNMAAMWKAQNPDLAYRTGNISAKEYRAMTGKYPAGYSVPNSGGGYYYNPDSVEEPGGPTPTNTNADALFRGMMQTIRAGGSVDTSSVDTTALSDDQLNRILSATVSEQYGVPEEYIRNRPDTLTAQQAAAKYLYLQNPNTAGLAAGSAAGRTEKK